MVVCRMNFSYIILAYLSLFALSLIDNGRGPAYPDILNTFSIGPSLGSYIFSLASFSSLAVSLTSKYWLARFGAVNSTKFSLALMGVSSWGLAYSGDLKSYKLLLFFSASLGVSLAILTITMNILVARGATIETRRRLFSGLHAVYGFSSFVAPAILSALVTYTYDWKTYFYLVGFIPLIVLFLSMTVHRAKKSSGDEQMVRSGIKKRTRVLYGLLFGSYVSAEITLSSRLPYYLQSAEDYSPVEANEALSIFFGGLLVGRLLFAIKHFDVKSKTLMYISLISSCIIFALGTNVDARFMPVLGFTCSFFFPTAMNYLNENFEEKSEFMTTSIMLSIGLMLSFMHWGFGLIAEVKGVAFAFYLIPLFFIFSFICLKISKKSSNQLI